MSPPIPVNRYDYSVLENQFSRQIAEGSNLESVSIHITSSQLTDLDADGASDDLFGTALLQVGSRFKSFIYLLRSDGATRFLEDSGQTLDPAADLRLVHCFRSRRWLCPDPVETARHSIHSPRISMLEYDPLRRGLELIIHRAHGRFLVVNPGLAE